MRRIRESEQRTRQKILRQPSEKGREAEEDEYHSFSRRLSPVRRTTREFEEESDEKSADSSSDDSDSSGSELAQAGPKTIDHQDQNATQYPAARDVQFDISRVLSVSTRSVFP